MGGLLSFCVLSGFTKTEESSVHGRFPLSSCAYWKTNSLSGKTVTGAMPVSHGETQMLLPESGSLLSIVATGRCAKVLLNGLLFLPTPRNASFPSEVLIFQASKSHALYICPPLPPQFTLELVLLQSQEGRISLLLLQCFSCFL